MRLSIALFASLLCGPCLALQPQQSVRHDGPLRKFESQASTGPLSVAVEPSRGQAIPRRRVWYDRDQHFPTGLPKDAATVATETHEEPVLTEKKKKQAAAVLGWSIAVRQLVAQLQAERARQEEEAAHPKEFDINDIVIPEGLGWSEAVREIASQLKAAEAQHLL